jgi:hypothetical protein
LLMVYLDTQVLSFSSWTCHFEYGAPYRKRVSTVIARHPPNHGHSRRHTTSFSIHPRIKFGCTRSAAHVWCQFFCPGPLPYSRNTRNTTKQIKIRSQKQLSHAWQYLAEFKLTSEQC